MTTRKPGSRRWLESGLAAALLCAAVMTSDTAAARTERDAGPDRRNVMRLVATEARNMGIPPALALAVARAESDFDIYARSHKGARGVMQIMPLTARGEYGIEPALLWNPRINIRLGLHFLRRLLERYEGRVDLALSYYNGGSAVGDLPHARVIPATRKYVRKVQNFRRAYSRDLARKGYEIGYRITGKQGPRGRTERGTGGLLPGYRGGDGR